MEIVIADHAGFCFGVKRATDIVSKELSSKDKNFYSLGPLIHNPQVVKDFEKKGLKVINSMEDVEKDKIKDSKVIIRSHGVSKSVTDNMAKIGLDYKDTTCPYVKSIYKKVVEYKKEGYDIIIIGDSNHPEVIGINGWCNNKAYIINSLEEANALPNMNKVCVVSQTTNTKEKFESLSNIIREKGNEVKIFNTICNATKLRQEACKDVAANVEAMIVIGGYHSSNTNKLVEISNKYCNNVYHIETADELPLNEISKFNKIGITAGASTPDWIIEEVVRIVDNINNNEEKKEEANEVEEVKEQDTDKEEIEEQEVNEEEVEKEEVEEEVIEEEVVEEEVEKPEVEKEEVFGEEEVEEVEDVKKEVTEEEIVEEIEEVEVSEKEIEEKEVVGEEEVDEEEIEEKEVVGEEVEEQKISDEEAAEKESSNEMMEAIDSSFTRIHRGEVLKGEVIFVTKNEVMVNINYKSDGIISREELSHEEDVNPKDLYKPGDEIDVYVIKLDDGEGNVILSAKRVDEFKNWDKVEELFNNKERVECTVKNIVKGGLIAVVNGVNGFMPASQISIRYVDDLEQYKGKTLIAKIIDFDKDKRRIILSKKEVEKEELENKRKELWATLEVGEIVEGVVQRLTNFGAFIDLGGLDGLAHISDLSWNRIKHPSKVVSIGEKIRVKVLSLDKERNRISLSLKETTEEPWIAFSDNVNIGDIVEGKIVNLLDFGAFVRLNEGVDGLLHVSEISKEHVDKPSDVLEVGQEINVKVIDINGEEKKISLSLKQAAEDYEDPKDSKEGKEPEKSEIVKEDFDTTIGDIINKDKEENKE